MNRFILLGIVACFMLSCMTVPQMSSQQISSQQVSAQPIELPTAQPNAQPTEGPTAVPTPTPIFLPMVTRPSNIFYVATNGSDVSGDGSESSPWATIGFAETAVPDGATILVQPGTYTGQIDIRRQFTKGLLIQSVVPYQAQLRYAGSVITCALSPGTRCRPASAAARTVPGRAPCKPRS